MVEEEEEEEDENRAGSAPDSGLRVLRCCEVLSSASASLLDWNHSHSRYRHVKSPS